MTGATGNWYCGLHEFEEMGFLLHMLRPEDRFLDVGANIGSYTVLAAGAVGARVMSVEPVPETFGTLNTNILLNGLSARVHCVNAGLGEAEGVLRVTSDYDTVNHVLADGEESAAMEIPATTVDALCADAIPTMMKIDVEGYERAVVSGGMATLRDSNVLSVIMETNNSGERYGWSDEELVGQMRDLGFGIYTYDPVRRVLETSDRGRSNTLFIRDAEAARRRVATARRFRLVNGDI